MQVSKVAKHSQLYLVLSSKMCIIETYAGIFGEYCCINILSPVGNVGITIDF